MAGPLLPLTEYLSTWTAKPSEIMLREEVISQELLITTKGTIRHFQLRVPANAEKIIGMECGVRIDTTIPTLQQPAGFSQSLQYFPPRVMGEIRLQNVGQGNLFYAVDVIEQDAHLGFADFSSQPGFAPKCWTHCNKREAVEVELNRQTAIIMGMYKDILGEQLNQNLSYWIIIHMWFATQADRS